MEELSVYDFDDDSGRTASVVEDKLGYFVHIKNEKKEIQKIIDVSDKSIYYAQDTAVNYATGIAKL